MDQGLLTFVKDVSIIVAGAVTLVGLFASGWEYRKKNRADRATHFVELRRRFLEDRDFRRIQELLIADDPGLREISKQERRNFIGFLEEVGLMASSGIVRREIAWCMFGRYIELADASQNLWFGLDPGSQYWTVFKQTVKLIDEENKKHRRRPLSL